MKFMELKFFIEEEDKKYYLDFYARNICLPPMYIGNGSLSYTSSRSRFHIESAACPEIRINKGGTLFLMGRNSSKTLHSENFSKPSYTDIMDIVHYIIKSMTAVSEFEETVEGWKNKTDVPVPVYLNNILLFELKTHEEAYATWDLIKDM